MKRNRASPAGGEHIPNAPKNMFSWTGKGYFMQETSEGEETDSLRMAR